MKLNKMFSTVVVLVVCIIALIACSSTSGNDDETSAEADDNWAEDNKIFDTETSDELYEKAKEEGEVVVYSKGSKFKKVKPLFEEKYPGIKVEPYKIELGELEEKLVRENEAGIHNADVVHVSALQNLIDDNIIYPYKPDDIIDNFKDKYKDDESPIQYFAINALYYNTDLQDEPPVNNWWDLTEPEWKGKVLIEDPTSNLSQSHFYVSMVKHTDEMAEAYKEKYGEELETTEENAAYEFVKRLIDNDPVMFSSSEDILDSIADSDDNFIGLGSSSKARKAKEQDLPIAPIYEMAPRLSHLKASTVFIADHAPHPNAAKLLARFVLDEEGLEPFNSEGVWIPQKDVENLNPVDADELKTWHHDEKFYEENYKDFRNFWISNID